MTLGPTATQLLDLLHRGGTYGYWWTMEGKASTWWEVGARAPLPTGRCNIYFGVHPTTAIPETNPRGEPAPPRAVRAQLGVIAAINCLYTEFDAKDFPNGKDGARAAADAVQPQPSVLIDSGGGYHLYWLFDKPWVLGGDEDRERAKQLQAAWVAYTGGDPVVKDLARVLRVPGTRNYKYTPVPVVSVVYADFSGVFTHDELAAHCRAELAALSTSFASGGQIGAPYSNGTSHYARRDDRLDRYVRVALDGEVGRVLRAQAGMKHDEIRTAAINLGTLVARGVLDESLAFDELARAADAHRADVRDSHRTILDGIAYGKQHPRDIPEPRSADEPARRTRLSDSGEEDVPSEGERLPVLLRADALHQLPPAEAIIPNLLYVNTLHQWFGAPGSGKSFLALDVAATVAQTRRVVYIAAEAIEDYESRLDAWQAHYGRGAGELYFWRLPLALADDRAIEQFIATVIGLEPAVVVLDPLADCMTGLDESSARDMSIAVYALNTIRRRTRAAVLAIHHTGWNQDHERGHSILRGACRVVVRVEASEDGLIRIICEKKNHGRKFDPRSFRLVSAGTKGGAVPLPARMVMPGKLRLTDKLLRVLEAMTTEPLRKGATHTDLVKGTDIPAATLNRILTALSDAGYITSEELGRSTKYRLTARAHDALTVAGEDEGGSWNGVGSAMEEGGRTWNWEIASSGGLPLATAVLPSSSISLPHSPPFPPLGGEGGVDGESKSSSTATAAVPGVYSSEPADGPQIRGFRAVDWFDAPREPDAPAEDELFPEPAPDAAGLIERLRAQREAASG